MPATRLTPATTIAADASGARIPPSKLCLGLRPPGRVHLAGYLPHGAGLSAAETFVNRLQVIITELQLCKKTTACTLTLLFVIIATLFVRRPRCLLFLLCLSQKNNCRPLLVKWSLSPSCQRVSFCTRRREHIAYVSRQLSGCHCDSVLSLTYTTANYPV